MLEGGDGRWRLQCPFPLKCTRCDMSEERREAEVMGVTVILGSEGCTQNWEMRVDSSSRSFGYY